MNRQFANAARMATPIVRTFTGDGVTPRGFLAWYFARLTN